MPGEIILIGDELISGRIGDSNARFAAAALQAVGLAFRAAQMVGDQETDILEAFRLARRADFVVVSGGLGTTDDDITNAAAARFFDLPLEEHPLMLANLRRLAVKRKRKFNNAHRRMALMPKGVDLLDGAFAGWSLMDSDGRPWFFLPGVPAEFTGLFTSKVVPALLDYFVGQKSASRCITVFGISEAEIGRRLEGAAAKIAGANLGYYPVFPEEKLILSVSGGSEEEIKAGLDILEDEICARLGRHVIVRGPQSLEEEVGGKLRERGLSLSLAESCTGGLIGHRITQVPGSSSYFKQGVVVYSNQSKIELLGVSREILDAAGAVSQPCAAAMAVGARMGAGTDLALAVTGIAGPDGGSQEKPVGTVFLALAAPEGVVVEKNWNFGDRNGVKLVAAEAALNLLRRYLAGDINFSNL
ncbi:MAG: CinA family nicotinamide mononucleotide deamidase-related protein [Desulfarculales bacterium]|jgi:nicotinamide-nucleotide amidase|nr:CinA family nicotinamide mononucleotide deamidase-related protein [Desulfarculales bacterium]